MLVSTQSFLNIINTNNNQALKEAVKQIEENPSKSAAILKDKNLQDILKNLFSDAVSAQKTGTTNTKILETLKNSPVFKNLGSVSNELKSLLNLVSNEPKLTKFAPALAAFAKEITTIDEATLKNQLDKSGVFLESKLSPNSAKNILSDKLQNILLQIKGELSNSSNTISKEAVTLIDKMLSSAVTNSADITNDLKSLLNILKSLPHMKLDINTKTIANLTQNLEQLSKQGVLIESKIQNSLAATGDKTNMNSSIKDLLLYLKAEVAKNTTMPNNTKIMQQIDKLLSTADIFSKIQQKPFQSITQAVQNLTNITQEIKANIQNTSNLQTNQLMQNITRLESLAYQLNTFETKSFGQNTAFQDRPNITANLNQTMLDLKAAIQTLLAQTQTAITPQIDKLLSIQNILLGTNQNPSGTAFNIANNLEPLLSNLKASLNSLSQGNVQPYEILKLTNQIENIIKNENILNPQVPKEPYQNILKQEIATDMKAILSQIKEEVANINPQRSADFLKHIDKMMLQIDYHQLFSYVSSSNSIYFPFSWDQLEEGSLSFKKLDKEKFYCEIDITLKDYGRINMMLVLYDKNKLDLSMFNSNEKFKKLVKEHLQTLKKALNSIGLIPVNIRLLEQKTEEKNKEKEIFNLNHNIGFGVDIRV